MSRHNRKRDIFAGADDIYQTKNSIAVRRVSQVYDKCVRYEYSDKIIYNPSLYIRECKKLVGRVWGVTVK